VNSKIITNSREKANAFNSHFESAFTDKSDKVPPDKGPSPHPIMADISIAASGIANLLNLNIHKALDPDKISTSFLKETSEVIAPILKLIFEKSLKSLTTGEQLTSHLF